MGERSPKSEEVKEKMQRLLNGQSSYENGEQMLSAFVQCSVQRMIQEALEKELTEHLGRGHYQHRVSTRT
ncbi:MAG: hypothetical protein HYS98_02365 [Deltaproteobacteria bacterium]|nr:hypothetical protein [Deltaproteobacteria bacterium]